MVFYLNYNINKKIIFSTKTLLMNLNLQFPNRINSHAVHHYFPKSIQYKILIFENSNSDVVRLTPLDTLQQKS